MNKIEPKTRFLKDADACKQLQAIVDSALFARAVETALAEMANRQCITGVGAEPVSAAYQLAGAKVFASILLNLPFPPEKPEKPTGENLERT